MGRIRDFIKFYFRKFLLRLHSEDHKALVLSANQLIKNILTDTSIKDLRQTEFRVFSQFGEDGIIQYLIHHLDIPNKIFIEFGVEDYTESNTRFLLINNNWKGMVLDGSSMNIKFIKNDDIYWRYNLTAIKSFITKENINESFTTAGITGDIGILSIDIDGNDYWIWEHIDVVSPRIVIAEYNSVLGPDLKVTVPYDPVFVRRNAHHSNLYFGASIGALCELAAQKGYYFIGSNSSGNNAFFIRNDVSTPFKAKSASEGYVKSEFREAMDESGDLIFTSGDDRIKKISHLKFFDLTSNSIIELEKLLSK
ncbi:hypothetical protein BH10BAC4_BH10BAC4_12710 [soil metagenome]